jgi:hypothetical protein
MLPQLEIQHSFHKHIEFEAVLIRTCRLLIDYLLHLPPRDTLFLTCCGHIPWLLLGCDEDLLTLHTVAAATTGCRLLIILEFLQVFLDGDLVLDLVF